MRYLLPIALALTGAASAQNFALPTNAAANNGLSTTGSGNLLDFSAGACDTVITHMTTASSAAANAAYSFEIFTRDGSGLGGPVASGPGSSPAGWTSLGVVNATQGPVASGISLLLDIPDIKVRAGTTVGVAFVFTGAGPRYFGTGTAPLQFFNDGNLTVTTGDARSVVFTTGGTWFSSRGHVGEFRGYHGCDLTITDCLPGAFVDISGTGTALNLTDDGEANITTTVGNAVLAAGTARVGSNGGVRFNGAGTDLGFTNSTLPNAIEVFGGDQTLLGFWDDFNTVGGTVGNIYWQEIGGTLYIQWQNAGFFLDAVNRATFQIQVHSSGPALAQFVYADIENARAAGGGSATIGYQAGVTGTNNYQYTLDAPNAVRNGSVLSLTRTTTRVFTPDLPGTWIEISGTGTALSLLDDGEVDVPTTVGNALFPQGVARVGSNGGVRFAGAGTELGFTNTQIPSLDAFAGSQALLPFWDDVNTVAGTIGDIYWQEVGDTLVVQWQNIGFFNTPATERATFQLQVHGSGNIPAQFLYRDIEGSRAASGGSATVGYQGDLVSHSRWSFDTASLRNNLVLSLVEAGRKVGASYCNANPNSTGRTGNLVLGGSSSVSVNNLRLNAFRLPNNAFGYFLASTTTGFVPNAGGGMGNICLGGNIGRAVGGAVLNTGASGSFGILANLAAIPQPGGPPVAALAGETWNFQAWHRDSVGGVATSNLTDAAQVQLTP